MFDKMPLKRPKQRNRMPNTLDCLPLPSLKRRAGSNLRDSLFSANCLRSEREREGRAKYVKAALLVMAPAADSRQRRSSSQL